MANRTKMTRQDRAKQFAPFDALKGLQDALRMKEYQHERIEKGDLSEEKIEEISKTLLQITKEDRVRVVYFENGHYFNITAKAKVDYSNQILEIGLLKIRIDDIFELEIVQN